MNVLNRRINVLALSLAAGLTWAIGVAGLALWAMFTNCGYDALGLIADCYPFYAATYAGCLWGALWGFIDVFCMFFIFALLYNLFAGKPKSL